MRPTRGLLAVALGLVAPAVAHADRREASLHAHVVGGAALVSDPASDDTGVARLGGVAVRASYARSNLYQYDAQLTLATTDAAALDGGTFQINGELADDVPFSLSTRVVRLDVGATFRFGVQFIPTVRLAVGVEERFRSDPAVLFRGTEQKADGRGGDMATDLVGVGAVGLDYRINRRLIAGASIGGTVALPLGGPGWQSIEASLHVAYYWYPRFD